MTDTLDEPVIPPERRRSSRNPTVIVAAVVAVAAVIALGAVTVVAVDRDDNRHTSMMRPDRMMDGPMMGHGAASPTVPGAREVAVSATSFTFTPDEIHVRAGEDVTIVLTARDVGHDLTIDDLGVHVAAQPGASGRGGLHAPSTPGRYTAFCSVAGHRAAGMTATVVVDAG